MYENFVLFTLHMIAIVTVSLTAKKGYNSFSDP